MSQLTIDIGNSRISAARVDGISVIDQFEGSTSLDPERQVAEAFDWCLDQDGLEGTIDSAVLSSVVPAQTHLFTAIWNGHGELGTRELHVVSHESPMPFEVDVKTPETVGADRFCNVAAAMILGHRHAIVVDLGTANTFDLLVAGVYQGGLIGPGAVTAHRALVEAGAKLPDLTFSWPAEFIGRTTPEAIRSGSFHQAVGAVRHVIGKLREHTPGAAVLVTGGLAEVIGPELGDEILYIPGLTHLGAAAIGRLANA
jgi:type III pantothenate kinase